MTDAGPTTTLMSPMMTTDTEISTMATDTLISTMTTDTDISTMTTDPYSSTETGGGDGDGGNVGLIVGLSVGIPLLVLVIVALAVLCYLRRPTGGRKRLPEPPETPRVPPRPSLKPYSPGVVTPDDHDFSQASSSKRTPQEMQAIQEFYELKKIVPSDTCLVAKLPANITKNRYSDVIPYDKHRVILKSGEYINASIITPEFIATQDPIWMRDEEFWSMIWEHNVSIIVRLSTEVDDTLAQQEQLPVAVYIPKKLAVLEDLEIKIEKLVPHQKYQYRDITLMDRKSNVCRSLVHYHLNCWKQDEMPKEKDFLMILQEIRKKKNQIDEVRGRSVCLVHCGAGAGRTGTVIAVWQLLDTVDRGFEPSVFRTVSGLRQRRPQMVNTQKLYLFIYKCLDYYRDNHEASAGAYEYPGYNPKSGNLAPPL